MAKIRASASTFFASDLLDCVVRLPEHVSGDLLLIIVAKDDATGGAFTTPAGWTKGGENNNGASGGNTVRGAWYYLVAASSAEDDPTVSSTDADTWSAVAVSIRGVHATPIDTSNGNGITDSTGNPYPAASVTTGFNDSLVFYAICSDGGVSPVAAPGFTTAGIAAVTLAPWRSKSSAPQARQAPATFMRAAPLTSPFCSPSQFAMVAAAQFFQATQIAMWQPLCGH
jgi:hypothetical protein